MNRVALSTLKELGFLFQRMGEEGQDEEMGKLIGSRKGNQIQKSNQLGTRAWLSLTKDMSGLFCLRHG